MSLFAIDFDDEAICLWSKTDSGVTVATDETYTPTLYVGADEWPTLQTVRSQLRRHPAVIDTRREQWRPGFRHDETDVLAVDVDRVGAVRTAARQIDDWEPAGDLRLYNVDLTRGFRYCLETDTAPADDVDLRTLDVSVPPTAFTDEEPGFTEATIEGETISGDSVRVLDVVTERIHDRDPDVLVLSTAEIVPALFETAQAHGLGQLTVGRRPGYEQLAGESTYESYGQVGHSPARYTVPGRVIIDESNTFFYHETNLAGCLDLVGRSWKPLEELAWASIGNVLTALQIREARRRNVLVPWRSWRHERFKTMRQLHAADRGGHIMSPEVGFHDDVHELDFASLYPNIICTRNVSPETVRCDCHDSDDVPELDYSICPDQGYLVDVLQPLIDDRAAIKDELAAADDPERRAVLEGQSSALKWILVACFGYQGFSNAKFGRIEAHEAINAYAREILLTAKERLEAGGWRVLHGIVDSIWVTPRPGADQTPLAELATTISADVGIDLEYEAAYNWVAFVPLRSSREGALTRYFGRRAKASGEDRFKYRGIECRQRSTCEWIAALQRELVACLDETREPERVCDRLQEYLTTLDSGEVSPEELTISTQVSKPVEEYSHDTRAVAALERAEDLALDIAPGQRVSFVVVDADRPGRQRVRLPCENPTIYDTEFYRERALRAAASVLSPLEWRQNDIESYLAARTNASVTTYEGN